MYTTFGPHRDDVSLQLFGKDREPWAVRASCAPAVLSMKLGETPDLKKRWANRPRCCWTMCSASWTPSCRNALFKSAAPLQTFITCTDRQDAAGAKADCFLQVTSTPEGTVLRRE